MIVLTKREEILVDREALAMLTSRSVHTIRARCRVARHRDGRPLYVLDEALATLEAIPRRRRRQAPGEAR